MKDEVEIKLRLPDVLTDRHWLIFTVHHVHVKQKTANSKSFLGIVSFTPGELLDTTSTIVGAGFLPLMAEGSIGIGIGVGIGAHFQFVLTSTLLS